ncbi:MAG: hypothetical protein GX643_06460 [Acidimicrobiales bacterium]|nr:hypothetical protein [Acidimicrobiales bacterium]
MLHFSTPARVVPSKFLHPDPGGGHAMSGAVTRPRGAMALLATLVAALVALVPAGAASAATTVVDGQLDWGIKSSFVSYITGPIAHGTVTPTGGATAGFTFPSAAGTGDGESFSVGVTGGVQFSGHEGVLEMSISGIQVTRSGSTGTLVATVSSKDRDSGVTNSYPNVTVATLDFTGQPALAPTGTTTYSNVAASLTAEAVPAFNDFYTAGTAMDPVSLTLVTGSDDAQTPDPLPTPGEEDPDDPATPEDPDAETPDSTTTTEITTTTVGSDTTPTTSEAGGGTTTVATTPPPAAPPAVGGAGGAAARPTALARTGSSPTLIAVGTMLLVAGVAVVATGRRVRSTH